MIGLGQYLMTLKNGLMVMIARNNDYDNFCPYDYLFGCKSDKERLTDPIKERRGNE